MLHYKRLEQLRRQSLRQCEIALNREETDPLTIKRMGLADKVGHRRRLQYYFDQMVDMYVVGKTNEAKISLMYNFRFFKRWRKKWKRKKKRIKKMQKWKNYLLRQKAKRILHAWHAFSIAYKKQYRTSSRAMQIQRIISGNIPGPHKHLKHDDIMVLDELWSRLRVMLMSL